MMFYGSRDQVSPPADLERSAAKIRTQRGELVEWEQIEGADHFYRNELDVLRERAAFYLDRRLAEPRKIAPPPRR